MSEAKKQFGLRHLFISTGLIATTLGGYLWMTRALAEADRQAVRSAYINSQITLEQARELYGDETDSWAGGADVHHGNARVWIRPGLRSKLNASGS